MKATKTSGNVFADIGFDAVAAQEHRTLTAIPICGPVSRVAKSGRAT